jgi:hypothetical protein
MLFGQTHHPQIFEWSNPHWGWFFAGMVVSALFALVMNRYKN